MFFSVVLLICLFAYYAVQGGSIISFLEPVDEIPKCDHSWKLLLHEQGIHVAYTVYYAAQGGS